MSMSVTRYLCRSRCVQGLVEEWQIRRNYPVLAVEAEDLVSECIDLAVLCERALEDIRALLHSDPNGEEIYEAGKAMKTALPKTQESYKAVQEVIAEANRKGCAIKNAAAFESAANRVHEVRAKIEMVFPELNKEMAEESREAFLRGECIPIEDLIREAQGLSVPAH